MFPLTKLYNSLFIAVLAGSVALASGCGSSSGGGGGGGSTPSTDAAANQALITNFIAQSGNMTGTWTNNTFSSTGDFEVTLAFDDATDTVTATVNVDGNVFGASNPDVEIFTIDASAFIANGTATISFTSDTYGDIEATLTFNTDGTGTFTGTATNVPGGAVTNAQASGTFTVAADGTISFSVTSMSFDFAGTGTITVTNTFN